MPSTAEASQHPRVVVEPRAASPSGMRPSGIKPIDLRFGGVLPRRPFVISGNPGTGKSIACLEFLRKGLDHGETVLLITHDEPADVLASAAFRGVDIDRPLREERLILLRFSPEFARQLCGASSARDVFEELQAHVASYAPTRIAIDSIVPFLDGGSASAHAVQSLIEFLDGTGATSLLTFPGDMVGLYDGRLEPLMHRSSAVYHLTTDKERNQRLQSRKGRYTEDTQLVVSFRIVAGAGIVVLDPLAPVAAADDTKPGVVLLNRAGNLPNDLDSDLRRAFQVEVPAHEVSTLAALAGEGVKAVLMNVRRDVFEHSIQLVRDLRRTNTSTPVILVTPYVLRSADRTRALRAGVDDFISTTMAPADAVARVRTIVKRGHRQDLMSKVPEPGVTLQPTGPQGSYQPLSGDALTKSIRGYLDRQVQPFFTLFVIRPEKGDIGGFARLALKIVRVESGDLVSIQGRTVIAYLDSARPKDLNSLRNRLRDHALRLGFGDIEIEAFGFPANEDAVREILGAPPASPVHPLSMRKLPRRGLSMKGARWT